MTNETFGALKRVVKETRLLLDNKYGHRKRLNRDEVWEKATLLRDIVQVEAWIDESVLS